MDKPIYLGFDILELSRLLVYETQFDNLQPYFGQENIQLHYLDFDSFVLSIRTQNRTDDLKSFEDLSDFSILDVNLEVFSNENKKVVGKFKLETPKNIHTE